MSRMRQRYFRATASALMAALLFGFSGAFAAEVQLPQSLRIMVPAAPGGG
ncbi:MAG: hypothetical protein ACREQK_02200 [Candidatus Binatia bacterium]